MNQDEREKHVEPQLYGSSVSFKLLKPNLSHVEDPRKPSCGFGTERGNRSLLPSIVSDFTPYLH